MQPVIEIKIIKNMPIDVSLVKDESTEKLEISSCDLSKPIKKIKHD